MKAVFGEAGPEAAIPLDDSGLQFLKKTFNLDDNSFNAALNNSDLYNAILGIEQQNIEIKEVLDDISYKMGDMGKPSFFESVTTSYSSMYSFNPSATNKPKKDNMGDAIIKKLQEIEELLKNIPISDPQSTSQIYDQEMSVAKMIATGILSRR
jgi:hypothetical protein